MKITKAMLQNLFVAIILVGLTSGDSAAVNTVNALGDDTFALAPPAPAPSATSETLGTDALGDDTVALAPSPAPSTENDALVDGTVASAPAPSAANDILGDSILARAAAPASINADSKGGDDVDADDNDSKGGYSYSSKGGSKSKGKGRSSSYSSKSKGSFSDDDDDDSSCRCSGGGSSCKKAKILYSECKTRLGQKSCRKQYRVMQQKCCSVSGSKSKGKGRSCSYSSKGGSKSKGKGRSSSYSSKGGSKSKGKGRSSSYSSKGGSKGSSIDRGYTASAASMQTYQAAQKEHPSHSHPAYSAIAGVLAAGLVVVGAAFMYNKKKKSAAGAESGKVHAEGEAYPVEVVLRQESEDKSVATSYNVVEVTPA